MMRKHAETGSPDLPKLRSALFRLGESRTEEDLYEYTARALADLCSGAVVSVNTIDVDSGTLQVRAIAGLGDRLDAAAGFFGGHIPGLVLAGMTEEIRTELSLGTVRKVEGGLYEAVFRRRVSREACRRLETLVGLKEVFSIGMLAAGRLFANATMFVVRDSRVDPVLVECFVRAAALALERAAAEREVRELTARRQSESVLRAVFRCSPDALTLADHSGIIQDCNDAALRLFACRSRDEAVGRPVADFICPQDRPRAEAGLRRTLKDGVSSQQVYRLLAATGEEFLGEISASVLMDETGRHVGILGMTRPVPEGGRMLAAAAAQPVPGPAGASFSAAGAEEWLSLNEVAAILKVKPGTLYKWITRREFPAHKAGWLWRFRRSEVEAWIRSQQHTRRSQG